MTTQQNRRSNGVTPIPEPANSTLRKRLEQFRSLNGVHRHEIEAMSKGTLQNYELHDISTMRLGDLFALACELGTTPEELITYLVTGVETPENNDTEAVGRRVQRMSGYMRSLPQDEQELAIDIVQSIMQYSLGKRKTTKVVRHTMRTEAVDPRLMVKKHLAEAEAANDGHN